MHHGKLYIGDVDSIVSKLTETIDVGSPDVVIHTTERLSIDDARSIIRRAMERPFTGTSLIFFIGFHSATLEAQNALLKLLEEPPLTAVFHIVVSHEEVLIGTVQSRLMHEESPVTVSGKSSSYDEFVSAPYRERLKQVEKAVKEKDSAWFESTLQELERVAKEKKDKRLMKEILMVRSVVDTAGASKKMLFEHLALVV